MRKILVFLILVVLLAACSKNDKTEREEKPQAEPQAENNQVEEQEELYKNTYPLTGIGTNDAVDQRIIAVMVNNHSLARPQTGLSKADVVFEILAEGMITRFLALYQSEQPEVVGPVRSAREYYYDLANRYGAIYVFHGGSPKVYEMLSTGGIDHIDGMVYDNDGNTFKRDSRRKAPHNSYLYLNHVNDLAAKLGYEVKDSVEPLPFLSKDEVKGLAGEAAKHIEIVYSENPMEIVEFDYDEKTEKYTRYNDREMTVELNTGEPIQVDNIFIVETHHEVVDDVGRREIDLYAGGNAYLIQKGKINKINWENRGGRIIPVKDGKEVGFVPGKTWINVVPTRPGMEKSVTITGE
jgi:molybdopterin converting factor small subunit